MPSIIDREADNWQVLLAIADEAGGEWPERARKAAVASHIAEKNDDASRLELLLGDIRNIFGDRLNKIASDTLVEKLIAIDGHPWAEYGHSTKPITQNRLARLLKPLKLAPEQIRFSAVD